MRGPAARVALVGAVALSLVAACSVGGPPPVVPTVVVTKTVGPASAPPVPTPASWADMFQDTASGVARIATTGCSGSSVGSGFLVAPDMVATAFHVVEGATSLSVRFGMDVLRGTVEAVDQENDLALVSLTAEPAAHQFTVAAAPARVGDPVAVLGYPFGKPLGMAQGAVTSTELRVNVEGADQHGMFRTDAVIVSGNSGGPIVSQDGLVVGVADAGRDAAGEGYAVAQPALASLIADAGAPAFAAPGAPECFPSESDPWVGGSASVTVSTDAPEGPSVASALGIYGYFLNTRDAASSWLYLTPTMQEHVGGQQRFVEGNSTSYWVAVDVREVSVVDEVTDQAQVALRTLQRPEHSVDGTQTCTDWLITYTLTIAAGFWQIDSAPLTDGAEPTACNVPYPDLGSLDESEEFGD